MAPTSTILLQSPFLFHPTTFSPPKTLIRNTPIQPSHLASVKWCIPPQTSTHFSVFSNKALPLSSSRFKPMGDGYAPVSAVSDDGYGLDGGSGGSLGGGRGGGGGGEGESGGLGKGNDGESNSYWSLLSWYLELLANFPVLTKAVTSALLTLIGDLICQLAIDKVASLDYKRTFVFSFLGLALVGPTLHFWYLYLSKLITLPGASGAFLRLILDQFVFAPMFIGVFLSALVTLEGRPSQVVPKLKQEWFSSVLANWQLWIPFQFLNFRFVPQQFQVLASNVVSLVWNVILSFKAHKEVSPK